MGVRGRTCIGCRRVRPRDGLVRLVRGLDGVVAVDASGHGPGRGAYVCPNAACFERGRRKVVGALRAVGADIQALREQFRAVASGFEEFEQGEGE